jgi:transposase
MQISNDQLARIAPYLPRQRGNVSHENLNVINAILYMVEHDCTWRSLPKHFGNWHTIYTRMNRWAKAGVLDRLFAQLQREQFIRITIEVAHPDNAGTAASLSARHSTIRVPNFIWLPRVLDRANPLSFDCTGMSSP